MVSTGYQLWHLVLQVLSTVGLKGMKVALRNIVFNTLRNKVTVLKCEWLRQHTSDSREQYLAFETSGLS